MDLVFPVCINKEGTKKRNLLYNCCVTVPHHRVNLQAFLVVTVPLNLLWTESYFKRYCM